MSTYKTLIDECNILIRTGSAHKVPALLSDLAVGKIPRQWRLPLANICRRAGVFHLGIGMLNRIVNAEVQSSQKPASNSEQAEYAMLLLRIGATHEAAEILDGVQTPTAAEVFHYRALVHMTNWEFQPAITAIHRYLSTSPPAYEAMTARTNLALAYLQSRQLETAKDLLDSIILESAQAGYTRLRCASLSYRAHLQLLQRNFTSAKMDIAEGETSIESAQTTDRLIFLKWRLILEGLEKNSVEPMKALRALAMKHKSWSDLRRADLYSLKINFEYERFLHLIFGTPFPGFHTLICSEFGALPDRDLYRLGPKGSSQLDLRSGEFTGCRGFDAGGKGHELIEVLLRDFYQPMRVVSIFNDLFPGEHFDPKSSVNRTRAVINRTRKWFIENRIPIEICQSSGFYSVRSIDDFSFLVPLERQPVNRMRLYLQELRAIFSGESAFSARQVREKLGVSKRTALRILDWCVENHEIGRLGENKTTMYRFGTPEVSRAA